MKIIKVAGFVLGGVIAECLPKGELHVEWQKFMVRCLHLLICHIFFTEIEAKPVCKNGG